MLIPWRMVGFTGHRRLPDEAVVSQGIARALDRLATDGAALAMIGSAAVGADTLCLEAAAERGLPSLVILPFERAEFMKDFAPDEIARVAPLIDGALDVEIAHGDDREEGFLEAGTLTVDRADVVLAVWDGRPPKGPGGTGAMVSYARALGKPVIVVDPRTGAITDGSTLDGASPPAPSCHARNVRGEVDDAFRRSDGEAKRLRPSAQWLLFCVITLHLVSSAAAVAGLAFHLAAGAATVTTAAKLLLLTAALLLTWRYKKAHHRWTHHRMMAELCRSYLALWPLRRRDHLLPQVQIPGFEHARRTLEMSWRVDGAAAVPFDEAREAYAERLTIQWNYFDTHYLKSEIRHAWLQGAAVAATLLALGSGIGALMFHADSAPTGLYDIFKFLSVVLPLANAAALSAVLAFDFGRRQDRYHQMREGLKALRARVAQARTWTALWRIARDGEDLLLAEAAEWLSVAKVADRAH